MRYISTRGQAEATDFTGALLTGLAPDGGLYMPCEWPQFSGAMLRRLRGRSYGEIAQAVMEPFVGESLASGDLSRIIGDAYAGFSHPAIAPLRQLDANHWQMTLFHGPTLAFKDIALQLLARLMDHALRRRSERATIVAATSGDTGSAALEAFRKADRLQAVVLYPHGRISAIQRRQMTTIAGDHLHVIALAGTFDDCQAMVKAMFNDQEFRRDCRLSAVNSINWARIMAQIVYYVAAALALGTPDRKVSFTVPTGNFGNIFAGYAAWRMGLPVDRLGVACNANDILHRTAETGCYQPREVIRTDSPSMDIQVASNFERLLFEVNDRDASAVRAAMTALRDDGAFTLGRKAHEAISRRFHTAVVSDREAAGIIGEIWRQSGELTDPHTAVGIAAARRIAGASGTDPAPMVTLATAHPAKFPEAVQRASGQHPPLPPALHDLMTRREQVTVLDNDLAQVRNFIRARLDDRSL